MYFAILCNTDNLLYDVSILHFASESTIFKFTIDRNDIL
jgi:hypothetical protein